MEPNDYYGAPINKVLHFIQNVGLIKGKHNRSLLVAVQGPDCGPPLIHTYIHTYTHTHTYIHTYIHNVVSAIVPDTFTNLLLNSLHAD
jgi:hypothetical protein